MDVTAKDIANHALVELKALKTSRVYRSDAALYREIGALSGLSSETVRGFHLGTLTNLSTGNLDKLVAAIKAARGLTPSPP